VLAVADVCDVLTSDRAYRSAMVPDDAGTAFDPRWVRPLRSAVAGTSATRAGSDVGLGAARV